MTTVLGVTPPGLDTPAMRQFLEDNAKDKGYTDLSWETVPDSYGGTYSRLSGTKAEEAY